MPLKPFSFPEDIRLLGYLGCVYKFKLRFSSSINSTSLPEIQSDIELAIDHILVGIPKSIKSIRTKSVTIYFKARQWDCETAFYDENGKELIPFSHSYKLFILSNEASPLHHVSSNASMNEFFGKYSFNNKCGSHSLTSPDVDVEGVSPSLPSIKLPYKSSRLLKKNTRCQTSPEVKRRKIQTPHFHEDAEVTAPNRRHGIAKPRFDDFESETEEPNFEHSAKPASKFEVGSSGQFVQQTPKHEEARKQAPINLPQPGLAKEDPAEVKGNCIIL